MRMHRWQMILMWMHGNLTPQPRNQAFINKWRQVFRVPCAMFILLKSKCAAATLWMNTVYEISATKFNPYFRGIHFRVNGYKRVFTFYLKVSCK